MKSNNFFYLLFIPLLFLACSKDDDNGGDDPNLEPVVLSGTQNAPLVLESLFNNPARVDYIIQGTWNIEAPVIVEPGVRFMMESGANIRVRASGSLNAEGIPDRPIYFEGAQAARGFWGYIAFESNNPNNRLEHAIIRHGGGSGSSNYPAAVVVRGNAQLGLVNSHISESQRNGFIIGDNDSRLSEFSNNTISNCSLYPILLRTSHAQYMDESTDFTSGNGFNQIQVTGNTVNTTSIIKPVAGPYLFTGTSTIEAPMEILPGTYIEMGPGARIEIRSTASLSMVGTENNRIIITGEQPAKGYWDYIYFNDSNSPNNRILFADISYGGGAGTIHRTGILSSRGGANFAVGNSSITNSLRYGITLGNSSTWEDLGGNVFSGNELGDIDN